MSSYSTYISSASKAGNFSTHWNCHHCSVHYHHLVVVGIIILVDIEELSQTAACQWCLVDLDCCLWRRSLTSRGLMSLVATSLPFSTFQGRHLCRWWQHIYIDKNNNSNNEDQWQYEYIALNVWSGRQLSVDNANNKYADKDNNNINEDNKDHIMMNTLPWIYEVVGRSGKAGFYTSYSWSDPQCHGRIRCNLELMI